MKARTVTNGREMVQALQDFESRLRRMAKCDALAERHAGTARARTLEEQAARAEREVDALRAALIAFAYTLPD